MKITHIIPLLLAGLALCSCDRENTEDIIPAGAKESRIYTVVHNDIIAQTFKHIELAEVFSGYQEIRSDRESALEFINGYFFAYPVYYEKMNVSDWGDIHLQHDGSFISQTWHWRQHWIMLNMEKKVHIVMPDKHAYSFSSISDEDIWDCTATVEDNNVTVSELTFRFSHTHDTYVSVCLTEPMTSPMCRNRKRKNEPVSGALKVIYKDMDEEAEFTISFNQNGKTLILSDGSHIELGPATDLNIRNEY